MMVLVVIGIIAVATYIGYVQSKTSSVVVKQTAIAKTLADSGTATIVTDIDGKILYWDDNATRLFNVTQEEAHEHFIDDFISQDEGLEARSIPTQSDRGVQAKTVFCFGSTREGDIIPLLARVHSPFKDNQVLIFLDEIDAEALTNNQYE